MKNKFRQDNRMNIIFSKNLAEFILSQLWRSFASLRTTSEGLRMTNGEGLAFLLQLKKSSLSCSPCQKNEGKQAGFTLLEVMISLAILSVGLLGMASLTASIIRTNSFSNDFTTATALTQDQLENLYNTSFGNLTIGTDIADASNPNPIDENGITGGTYTRTWTIAASGNNKSITVTVAWTSDYGTSKSISISTIRSSQT